MSAPATQFTKVELKLRRLYQVQDKLPKLIDDDQFEAQSLREYYIKLRVVAKGDEDGEAVTMRELFSRRDGRPAGRVLITGGAGLGKSTLLHYVAFRWSLEADAQQHPGGDDSETTGGLWHEQFRRVLRVPLKILSAVDAKQPMRALVELVREGLNAHDVYDPRGELYFEDAEVSELLFDGAGAVRPGTLLLLDGFDEVAQEASRTGSVVRKVLDLAFTEFDHFVVTTRPNAVDMLPKSARVEREIENVGLGTDGVRKFLDTFFRAKRELGDSLSRFLRANPGVEDMCTIPINMALLCVVWTPAMRQRFEARFRLIDLYEEVVLWLGRRYMRRCGRDVNEATLEIDVLETDVMRYLMELAYDGLSHGALRLDKDAMQRAKRKHVALDLKAVYEFGLLKPEGSGRGVDRVHLFIHLSFQEYLAALQLLHKLRTEDTSVPLAVAAGDEALAAELPAWASIEQHRSSARWLMTLKFLAGFIARETERNEAASRRLQTVFWESVSCNRDGVVELGMRPTVVLLMHLLAQGEWDLEKVPNGVAIAATIDQNVNLRHDGDTAPVASGYLSKKLAEELKKALEWPGLARADTFFRFRHHPYILALDINIKDLFKTLLDKDTYAPSIRRLEEHLEWVVDSMTKRGQLREFMEMVLEQTLKGLRPGWSATASGDAIRLVVAHFPDMLNKSLLHKILQGGAIGTYIDTLMLFPEDQQVQLAERRCDRFTLPNYDADNLVAGVGQRIREALVRLPKITTSVRSSLIRKINEKMLQLMDCGVIADVFGELVCATHDRQAQFIDGLCDAISQCDARAGSQAVGTDRKEPISDDDGDHDILDIIKAYDKKHNTTGDDTGSSADESKRIINENERTYQALRFQEATVDAAVLDATRQALFPIEHLMFISNAKEHPVLAEIEAIAAGYYRTIKGEVGRCVAYCVQSYPTQEKQIAAICKLHSTVLGSPAAKAKAVTSRSHPSIGFVMAAVHGLFQLMFDNCVDVSAAARAAIASVWKETVVLSEPVQDGATFLQLQELYMQRTDLGERRQVLRMLEEVSAHDLRRGLDAMLDLLTLSGEMDTSTAVHMLPEVLAAVSKRASAMTLADRERLLHRLCVVSACYPDHAADVEAVGVAIVQAAVDPSSAPASWKDVLRLSLFGVGADDALRVAQRLMVNVPSDELEREVDHLLPPRGVNPSSDSDGGNPIDRTTVAVDMPQKSAAGGAALSSAHDLGYGQAKEVENKCADDDNEEREQKESEVDDDSDPTSQSPGNDGIYSARVQLEAMKALRSRVPQTAFDEASINWAALKWCLPEDLSFNPPLALVHPHYRRTGVAAKTLRQLWGAHLVKILGILQADDTTSDVYPEASSLQRLSWTFARVIPEEEGRHSRSISQPSVPRYESSDLDKLIRDAWKEWKDDQHLCPSIGAQVIVAELMDLPPDQQTAQFANLCTAVARSDNKLENLENSIQARKRRVCLEVIVEMLLQPPGSELHSISSTFLASFPSTPHEQGGECVSAVCLLLWKRLQRSSHKAHITQLMLQAQALPIKNWKAKRGEMVRPPRVPQLHTVSPTDYFFGRSSPLWAYDEESRKVSIDFLRTLVTGSKGSSSIMPFIHQCLASLMSPPNKLLTTIVMDVLAHCITSINWNQTKGDDDFVYHDKRELGHTLKGARMIVPAAATLLLETLSRTQPRITLDLYAEDDVPLKVFRADLVSAAAKVYRQEPECLDAFFSGGAETLGTVAGVLVSLSSNLDRDSKELEAALVSFFERFIMHIEEHNNQWLTPERATVLRGLSSGLLLDHPVLEKLRRTLLARLLANGELTAIERNVINKFIAGDMTVSLTRRGCVMLDEMEYPMRGETVELLAQQNKFNVRRTFARVVPDARTAAADIEATPSLFVEGRDLRVGDAVLSLLHDEGSATQVVVLERRTVFGDILVRTVDCELRMGDPRTLHPLAGSAERERMRRELAWEPLYGRSADGKFREHTWWHFDVGAEKQRGECLKSLCAAVAIKPRLPAGVERPSDAAMAAQSRLDLVERVREFVGAAAFEAAVPRLRASAADVLRPVDDALRTELQLHAMSRRLRTTEGAIAGLRDGLTKLEVSVEDATRTIDALTAMMPDLEQLPRLLERERDAEQRAAEVQQLESGASGDYARGVYHELRSQLNGVYVAASAVMSGIVANSQTGTAGVVGSVLSAISGAIPVVGSAVGCIGAMLSAVDGVQQEERLRRYASVAASSAVMDGIAEFVARRVAQMGLTPAEVRATLSKPDLVSEKLGEVKRVAMRYLAPPTTVAGTNEHRGRQDGAQLAALITVKLQEGEAIPPSPGAVCDMIIAFVEVRFNVSPPTPAPTTLAAEPRPPSEQKPKLAGSDSVVKTGRAAEEPSGACCSVM